MRTRGPTKPRGARTAWLGFATLAAVVSLAPPARAWRVFVTAQGAEVRWLSPAPPFALQPGWPLDGGDAAAASALETGLAAWGGACGLPPLSSAGLDERARLDDADGLGSVVWIDSAANWNARFGATELARTLVAFRVGSGAIIDTDIAVNLGGHAFAAAETCAPDLDRYDLASVLTHELGHALGLDHSDVPEATMFPKTVEGRCDLRSLAADDLAGLCHLYPASPIAEPGPEPAPEPSPELPPEPPPDASSPDATLPADLSDAPPDARPVEPTPGCAAALSAQASTLLALSGAALLRRLLRGLPRSRRRPA